MPEVAALNVAARSLSNRHFNCEVPRRLRGSGRQTWRSRTYSPAFLRKLAIAYSRFNFAMKLALISAGQTASHS